MPSGVEESGPFDAEKAIKAYRRAFSLWERTRAGHVELKRMRAAWKESQGKDSLHEMAFGEPVE